MADWNPYTGSPDEGPGIMDPALYASPPSLGELERRTRYFDERAQARREAERMRMRPRAGEYVAAVAIAFMLFALLAAVYVTAASAVTPLPGDVGGVVPAPVHSALGLRNDVRGPQTGVKPFKPVKTKAKTANHAGGLICTNSYFSDIQAAAGTLCIPKPNDGWAKYQLAAVSFWNQQPPPSPRTTKWGNLGAEGYGHPHWCRNAWPYYYYPHGVKTYAFDGAYPWAYVTLEGRPPTGTGDGHDEYCTIFMRRDIYNGSPTREKCLIYVHEWGHLLGWSHDNYPSPNGWIMDPYRSDLMFNVAPLQARQACAAYVA